METSLDTIFDEWHKMSKSDRKFAFNFDQDAFLKAYEVMLETMSNESLASIRDQLGRAYQDIKTF